MKSGSLKNKTALLVDDEPNILLALEVWLQREGFQEDKALNGMRALEKLALMLPAIAILNVLMPGMDGFELARRIRNNAQMEQPKIVFLTAKGTSADKIKGYDAHGEYY